jgi:GT2 family glycosyltransferase
MNLNNIGIGIVTCNRDEFLDNLIKSLPEDIYTVIVNDGDVMSWEHIEHEKINDYHYNAENLGVGKSKNILFRKLMEKGFEHIFIIEDDMLIKDKEVFNKYIEASQVSGIKHMMFGYHGPANKRLGKPHSRFKVPYNKEVEIAFNLHCVGSFCYYHKDVLDDVGIFDEQYNNAWEHVDHSYQIVKAGYLPAYWFWPDLANSYDYIDEQACSNDNSVIRPRGDWQNNIKEGAEYFVSKNGYAPGWVPNVKKEEIYPLIKDIRNKYAIK